MAALPKAVWCRVVTVWALLLSAAFVSQPSVVQADEPPVVIWLSLDGVRHDFPARRTYPALSRMAREGVRAQGLRPVFPTSTFPNHVSIATCSHVDRHGIVANKFVEPGRGVFDYGADATWIDAEPIWVTAEREGLRSAVYYWVGGETDWHGVGATYRETPFDSDITESTKVDQLLAWFDLPQDERPQLMMSWWRGTDGVAHRKGPASEAVAEALALQDEQLGRLLRGLDARDAWRYTTVFVSSDHGMTESRTAIDVPSALAAAGIEATVQSGAAVAFVYLDTASEAEAARAELQKLTGHHAYLSDQLPEELRARHPTRTGDVVLVAEPPYYYARSGWRGKFVDWLRRTFGFVGGSHGYRPSHPDMAGVFYAKGRGVAGGQSLGLLSNLDLAPTASRLLGIRPPSDCEGKSIPEIGGTLQ